jgi:putative transposase
VVESDVTKQRGKKVALNFLRRSLRRHRNTGAIVTDRLAPRGAALTPLGPAGKRETRRWLNNRAENSNLLFRRQERAGLRFRRMRNLPTYAALKDSIRNNFNPERSLIGRKTFKDRRSATLAEWQQLGAA